MKRPRRLRQHQAIREFVQEYQIPYDKLVLPLFIRYGEGNPKPILSMPGHAQIHLAQLPKTIVDLQEMGLKAVILFGIPSEKDPKGSLAYDDLGLIQTAIRLIKDIAPEILVMADTCLCEYTSHGHCGILTQDYRDVENDSSIEVLAKTALSYAKAGVDVVAPSACMDNMVKAIRKTLDEHQFKQTLILSYAVKYASNLYGPFRQAAEGAPQHGDRKTYQMDYQTKRDAVLECALDIEEGADMLLVKPGHTYLDIIHQIKEHFPQRPLGAYHTSGEFAMIKAASEKAWIDEKAVVHEVMIAFKRAGCDFIITYYAKELLAWRNALK
jgi:porphobilinogen synthase